MRKPHPSDIFEKIKDACIGLLLISAWFLIPTAVILLLVLVEPEAKRPYSLYKEYTLQDDLSILAFKPAATLKIAESDTAFKPGSVFLLCAEEQQAQVLVKTTLYGRDWLNFPSKGHNGTLHFSPRRRGLEGLWIKDLQLTLINEEYLDSLLSLALSKENQNALIAEFRTDNPRYITFFTHETAFKFKINGNKNSVPQFLQSCGEP
ncbi:hypothetical protein [Pseudovibrio sp. Alg231-02]|uniref:hypothetical protein n=1 Tax=Pseudovibrio sp. Alg231-02 TaxID=1922223 RepID=UPI000D550031|nr:hypothetical protein [Pseudovibrio sp. Alg231-02]